MIEDLAAVLAEAVALDPSALADAESVVELHRCLARLEAVTTRAAPAFEGRGQWQADGARSAAAWLAVRCRVPKAAAGRRVHLGRGLRHLPAAEAAWLAGDIGRAQVAALAGARNARTEDALDRDEEMLARVGDNVQVTDLARTPAQRRADALVTVSS